MEDRTTNRECEGSPPPAERKTYHPPALVVYGSIRELTRQGGPHALKDGGNNALGNRT